jgi:hypothetical protein
MTEHEDSDIARVLRAAQSRTDPASEMRQSVFDAVHAEWRATVEKQKKQRSRRVWLAMAASVLLAAVALFFGRTLLMTPKGAVVASVSRSTGIVQVKDATTPKWSYLGQTKELRAGERIHTGADGRVAITMPDGVSVRLDRYSNIGFISANEIELFEGAAYIDSGSAEAVRGALKVRTPSGVLRHIGTQYEVREMLPRGTRVRVREGRVSVERAGVQREFASGSQLMMSNRGIQEGERIDPYGEEWSWVVSTAPEFNIDGRPADEFLAWAARETGLKVVFATPDAAAEAKRAVLNGSIAGLSPDEALAAVLPTVSLQSTQREGQLIIELVRR